MAGPQPADFGNTVVQGNVAPSVAVQNPVVNDSGKYLAEAADAATTGVGGAVADIFKSAATSQTDKVLNDYRQKIVQLGNWVDQGGDPTAARLRQRTLYSSVLANNPSLGTQLDQLNSKLLDSTGIGATIQTGNDDYKRQQQYADDAAKAGWIDTSTGKADVTGYQTFQNQARATATTIQNLSARAAVRGEATALEKDQAHAAVTSMAKAAMPWVNSQLQQANTALAKTTDPSQRAAIIQGVQQTFADQIGQFSTGGLGENTDYITKPIQDMMNTWVAGAEGKVDADTTTQQINLLKAKADYVLMADPKYGPLIAASDLFGQGSNEVVSAELTKRSAELFGQNAQPYDGTSDSNAKPADVVSSDGDTKGYLDSLQSNLDYTLNNPGVNNDKIGQQVSTQMTNLLRSVGTNASDSPKDYNSIINFYSSNSVARWIRQGKVAVPQNVSAKAVQAIQDNYGNVLLPLVEQKWLDTTVPFNSNTQGAVAGGSTGTQTRVPVSQVIDPVWDGNQLTFKPKPQYANNPAVIGTARNMNSGSQSLAGPINTFIKASAHMNNDTDYDKVWQALGGRLFDSSANEGTPSKTDTIGEFNQQTTATKQPVATPTSASVQDIQSGRNGGSLSFRNNNPGNIRAGDFAEAHGAVGSNEGFAVFPDYETGRAANAALFSTPTYTNKTLAQAITRYAPANDHNDTQAYINSVAQDSGIDPNTVIGTLNKEQMGKLLDAIQKHEGWKPA